MHESTRCQLYPSDGNHASPKRFFCLIFRIIFAVTNDIKSGQISLRASSLVYSSFLSLVPLLAFSFAVLKAFGVHNAMEPILLELLQPLGDKGLEISQQITAFVGNMKVGTLGTFGLVILLYTIISMTSKIEDAFNHTWRVDNQRNFTERFTRYLSVIIVAPILMFTALGLSASIAHSSWLQEQDYTFINHWLDNFILLLPKFMIIVAFAFSYWFIPNTRVKFSAALIGALVAGSLWLIAGSLFAKYVAHASQQIAIYSVFATLLFFIIWMNVGWMILLIGSSIAYYAQNPEQAYYRNQASSIAIQDEEHLAISLLQHIAKPYYQQESPVDETSLRKTLQIPPTLLRSQLTKLQQYGLITADNATPPHYLPAKPMSDLSLDEATNIIRKGTTEQQALGKNLLAHLSKSSPKGNLSIKDSLKQPENQADQT